MVELAPVDLVVTGCVAVGVDGARLGKGGGFADLEFALATAASGRPADMLLLGALAAEAVAIAIVRAVQAATSVTIGGLHVPALRDLP